jgi:hypothetical protein
VSVCVCYALVMSSIDVCLEYIHVPQHYTVSQHRRPLHINMQTNNVCKFVTNEGMETEVGVEDWDLGMWSRVSPVSNFDCGTGCPKLSYFLKVNVSLGISNGPRQLPPPPPFPHSSHFIIHNLLHILFSLKVHLSPYHFRPCLYPELSN